MKNADLFESYSDKDRRYIGKETKRRTQALRQLKAIMRVSDEKFIDLHRNRTYREELRHIAALPPGSTKRVSAEGHGPRVSGRSTGHTITVHYHKSELTGWQMMRAALAPLFDKKMKRSYASLSDADRNTFINGLRKMLGLPWQ